MEALDHVRKEIQQERKLEKQERIAEYTITTKQHAGRRRANAALLRKPSHSKDIDFEDLSWEDKERVLRVLFAKMNGLIQDTNNESAQENYTLGSTSKDIGEREMDWEKRVESRSSSQLSHNRYDDGASKNSFQENTIEENDTSLYRYPLTSTGTDSESHGSANEFTYKPNEPVRGIPGIDMGPGVDAEDIVAQVDPSSDTSTVPKAETRENLLGSNVPGITIQPSSTLDISALETS
jgi:hypothetical protein